MAKGVMKHLDRAEEGITMFFFLLMGVFIFLQLFSRFVLKNPLMFTEEIARYSYVWIAFIGMSLSTKTSDHIKVDFFIGLLPDRFRVSLERIVNLINIVILVYLSYLGFRFAVFSRMNVSAALYIPLSFVYISFPIGCLLTAFRTVRILFPAGEKQ